MQDKHKKNLYKILFIVILLSFIISLIGCDWFSNGLFGIFDPQAQTGAVNAVIKTTPDPATGTVPFTVYFDASGCTFETGCGFGSATYSWNFGDGTPLGTDVTTSHTYTSNGVYTVILTVTDSAGNVGYGSVIITVGVAGKVNAVIEITPSSATGTFPFTVGLDASESTTSASGAKIASYTWNFDAGIPLIEVHNETPVPIPVTTHTYAAVGTYLVKLTVLDSLGNIGYAFKSIIVTKP